MSDKPELILFSQNLMGGGASFHRNMLSQFPRDFFDIKSIYINPANRGGAKALDIVLSSGDEIFTVGSEPQNESSRRLSKLIPNGKGAISANQPNELIALDLFGCHNKTIYFICHDDGFVELALKFKSIIDVFIAHNISVFETLTRLLKGRVSDIYFIQHGVSLPEYNREPNKTNKLRLVFLARHYEYKGLFELPEIDKILRSNKVEVDWTILGDGPDRNVFIKRVEGLSNFRMAIPVNSTEVIDILKEQDVFVLPSRIDGLPVALLESMSVGCVPVIANFSEGIKKVVTEKIGYVLPVGDTAGFARKIEELSSDRNLLAFLSENCRKKVEEEFDIKKQSLAYYDLYKKYGELKRKRLPGPKDIFRKISYYETYKKAIHLFRTIGFKKYLSRQ